MGLKQDITKFNASLEVSYSEARREEMKKAKETNCVLLITDLRDILINNGASNIRLRIPKNKNRYTDIILDFNISPEEELEKIRSTILNEVKDSVGTVELFVEDNTE